MKKLFFAIAFIMVAAHLHAIPGDLNEDGRLNIADQVMLTAMVENRLDQTKAADLNFDDNVDRLDMELLTAAIVHGKPLPQLLNTLRVNQYASGGWSVSGGGLTLDIPGQCYRQCTISLTTLPEPPDLNFTLEECSMTPPVIVYGMQGEPAISEASFTLDVPPEHNDKAGKPMLLMGFYNGNQHQSEPQWNYRVIPAEEEFDITYTNRKLVWTPDFSLYYDPDSPFEAVPFTLSVIYRTTPATRNEKETTQTRADEAFFFEKMSYILDYGIYRSNHFIIELQIEVPEAQVRELAKELEKSYEIIGTLGMPRMKDFYEKWKVLKIWVNITKNPIKWHGWLSFQRDKTDDASCNPPTLFKPPFIDVPIGAMDSPQRMETCCHELFHYHQFYYAKHATAMFLDEMVGTWSEYLVTPNPNSYIPNNYLQPRAVINGLYRKSWAETLLGSKHYAGHHGYTIMPFARWLTEIKYPGKKLWPAVFRSRSYKLGDGINALKTAIGEMNDKDTLASIYPQFMRDYFADTQGIPYKCDPNSLFSYHYMDPPEAAIDRYKETGLITSIKNSADMFEPNNQKHTFSVQNFGAATWRYNFINPSKYLKDYTHAIITFNLPQGSAHSITDFTFFARITTFGHIIIKFLTKEEDVTVDKEKNIAQMVIPLEKLAEDWESSSIGIVAVYAHDSNPADSRVSLTMSVDFPGPVIANGLVGWIGDYIPKQDAKATADLAFIPVNGTVFLGAEFDAHESGNQFRAPNVITRPGSKPKDVMFNITGVIRDATATIEDPSTVFSSEFMEKVEFVVSKTSKENVYSEVPYEKLLFDGKNYTPMMDNAVPVSIFLPTAADKNSKFYLKIPNFDYNATLYNISMQLPYTEYTIKDHAYFVDRRNVVIINFTIYMGNKSSEWILGQ